MKKNANKIFMIIISIIFTYILINSLYLESNVYYKQNSIISLIVSTIVLGLWYFIYSKIFQKEISNKKFLISIISYFILVTIFQFISIKSLSSHIGWDYSVIYSHAYSYVYEGNRLAAPYMEYLDLFRNNFIIFFIDYLPVKASQILHLQPIKTCILLNLAFIDGALLILITYLRKKHNNATAIIGMIVSLFFIPLFLYSSIFYSDTYSLFIPILLVFIIDNYRIKYQDGIQKRDIVYWIILGLMLFIGKEIKLTSIFIIIGYLFDFIFEKGILKKIVCILIMVITYLILSFGFQKLLIEKESYCIGCTGLSAYPPTHWIMMGIEDPNGDNSHRNSYGGFNQMDYEITKSFQDDQRVKENLKEYIRRLKEYGFTGYYNYLTKKAVNAWGDGYYFADVAVNMDPRDDNKLRSFIFKDENTKYIGIYFTQGVQFAMLICLILGSILKINDKNIDYKRIAIFGLFVFLLFWENRSRYLFNYIPVFITIIVEYLNIIEKNKKHNG